MRINPVPHGRPPISSTMFSPMITSQKHQKSLWNHQKSQSEAGNHSWVWKKYQFSFNPILSLSHSSWFLWLGPPCCLLRQVTPFADKASLDKCTTPDQHLTYFLDRLNIEQKVLRGVNSLAPGRFKRNFRRVIFQLILVIDSWSISCKIVLKWMPMDLTDGKSTLV